MAKLSGIRSPIKQVNTREPERKVDNSQGKKLDFGVSLVKTGKARKETTIIDLEKEAPSKIDAKAERRARLLALAAKAKSRHNGLSYDDSASDDESAHSANSTDASIAGFIVSDDEEISYCESSWLDPSSSSEDEKPAPPRRRLVRGRPPSYTTTTSTTRETRTRSPSSARGTSGSHLSSPQLSGESKSQKNNNQPARGSRSISRSEQDVRRLSPTPSGAARSRERDLIPDDGSSTTGTRTSLTSSTSSAELSDQELFVKDPGSLLTNQIYQLPISGSKLQSPSKRQTRAHDTSDRRAQKGTLKATRPIDQLFDFSDFSDSQESDLDVLDLADFEKRITPETQPKSKPIPRTPGKSKSAVLAESRNAKKEKQAKKRAFDESKDALARALLETLDELVTHGQIQDLAASEGGVHITWSKTLNKTAGRANWKRVVVRNSNQTGSESDLSGNLLENQKSSEKAGSRTVKHIASIELAEKIIDCEERLYNTLAHEFCHLANFMISRVVDNPHGESFRCWAAKCMAALAKHPTYAPFNVTITTRHSYKIDYKYVWSCSGCALEYGRHSKSIDPTKVRCGRCKTGVLTQIKPKPRSVSPKKKAPPKISNDCKHEASSAIGKLADKLNVITLD
ncbi:sprT family metallopeptidase [Ascosphaera apis ARSEF 7405]|uniref:SprT family metallopeptidase n=1 Tax=Ascosphaera apis ARSEF 7405 TaxID=392613 RepID=A0A168CRD4_9EURO|nr:sprT family metallopeptidase [Ascosphaera apis ARSEF 7405]